MSALAMILAAGMVVGDGPAKVSGELEQRLDLRGVWVALSADGKETTVNGEDLVRAWKLRDKGNGRFRMNIAFLWSEVAVEGTYRQENDRIVLSVRQVTEDPFDPDQREGDGVRRLILRRVKPAK